VILSQELDPVTEVHASAMKWLLERASECPTVQLLATAPGIGVIRVAQIVAIVLSPNRLRTRQYFYCGPRIVMRSSSDWARDRHGVWARRETTQTRCASKKPRTGVRRSPWFQPQPWASTRRSRAASQHLFH